MLKRDDVIGSPIRRIRQVIRPREIGGWLDLGRTWFTLDSGVSFTLPRSAADARFLAVPVPADARELVDPRLVGARIVEVYRAMDGEQPNAGESAVLELEGGLLLTESNVAPHGTDAVGLYAFTRDEWAALDTTLAPFWR